MTDPMELVARLEKVTAKPAGPGGIVRVKKRDLIEAAACIRDMVEVSDRMDQVLAAYLAGEPNDEAAERVRAKYDALISPPAPGAE